jgi:hypothetical protein
MKITNILTKLAGVFHPASKAANTSKPTTQHKPAPKVQHDNAFFCHAHPHSVELRFVRNAKTRQGYPVKIFSCPDCGLENVVGRNFSTGAPMVLSSGFGTPDQTKTKNPQDWSPGAPVVIAHGINASTQPSVSRQRSPRSNPTPYAPFKPIRA